MNLSHRLTAALIFSYIYNLQGDPLLICITIRPTDAAYLRSP